MQGPHDLRTGTDREGHFAVQFRLRKDDPTAPYIVAAMEQAAHLVVDPVSGFRERRESDAGAAADLEQVIMGLLPEDLRLRLAAESVEIQKRAKDATVKSLLGAGLGQVFSMFGASEQLDRVLQADSLKGQHLREVADGAIPGEAPCPRT